MRQAQEKIHKTFAGVGAIAEAKGWRAKATVAVRRGTMRTASQITLTEAAHGDD